MPSFLRSVQTYKRLVDVRQSQRHQLIDDVETLIFILYFKSKLSVINWKYSKNNRFLWVLILISSGVICP